MRECLATFKTHINSFLHGEVLWVYFSSQRVPSANTCVALSISQPLCQTPGKELKGTICSKKFGIQEMRNTCSEQVAGQGENTAEPRVWQRGRDPGIAYRNAPGKSVGEAGAGVKN